MKYSFIIPVFNRPDEVDELLDSLTRQTLNDFEVIVVEDGSQVPCEDICRKYAARLDIHYYMKPNSGPGQSRNYGVERAKGEYVLILDSDVVVPENYLRAVDAELQREPADAFGGPDRAADSFTPVQKAISYSMTSFFTTGGIRGGKKKLDKFYPRSFNMGVRRDVYQRLGGFSKMRFGEDIDFSIRIFRAGCKCRLFPEAWVWHKRRTDFRKFWRQVYNSGIARINLYKKYEARSSAAHGVHRGSDAAACWIPCGRSPLLRLAGRHAAGLGYRRERVFAVAPSPLCRHHLLRCRHADRQRMDRIARCTRSLHPAYGLWLRLSAGLVATLRERQG